MVEADKKKRKKVVVVTVTKTSSRSGNPSRGLIEQEATKDEEKSLFSGLTKEFEATEKKLASKADDLHQQDKMKHIQAKAAAAAEEAKKEAGTLKKKAQLVFDKTKGGSHMAEAKGIMETALAKADKLESKAKGLDATAKAAEGSLSKSLKKTAEPHLEAVAAKLAGEKKKKMLAAKASLKSRVGKLKSELHTQAAKTRSELKKTTPGAKAELGKSAAGTVAPSALLAVLVAAVFASLY